MESHNSEPALVPLGISCRILCRTPVDWPGICWRPINRFARAPKRNAAWPLTSMKQCLVNADGRMQGRVSMQHPLWKGHDARAQLPRAHQLRHLRLCEGQSHGHTPPNKVQMGGGYNAVRHLRGQAVTRSFTAYRMQAPILDPLAANQLSCLAGACRITVHNASAVSQLTMWRPGQ